MKSCWLPGCAALMVPVVSAALAQAAVASARGRAKSLALRMARAKTFVISGPRIQCVVTGHAAGLAGAWLSGGFSQLDRMLVTQKRDRNSGDQDGSDA